MAEFWHVFCVVNGAIATAVYLIEFVALYFSRITSKNFLPSAQDITCTVKCTNPRLLFLSLKLKAMRIISFTEARKKLKAVLDEVVNNADCTVITRRDTEDAVVMSLEYYNSLMETVYLLKSPANAAHLSRSIEQFQAGQVQERALIDD